MANPSSSEFSDVIDWTEAMEQCGDDEDFLHELLGDLKGEIDTQIIKIEDVLKVSWYLGMLDWIFFLGYEKWVVGGRECCESFLCLLVHGGIGINMLQIRVLT